MSFADTLEKIESSDLFKNFKEQNPDAELVAGFFILDFLSNDTKQTLDYKIDSKFLHSLFIIVEILHLKKIN